MFGMGQKQGGYEAVAEGGTNTCLFNTPAKQATQGKRQGTSLNTDVVTCL